MTFYKDYFGIRPDYAPCMTLADINKTPETWLGFYPHDSFVEILRELAEKAGVALKPLAVPLAAEKPQQSEIQESELW